MASIVASSLALRLHPPASICVSGDTARAGSTNCLISALVPELQVQMLWTCPATAWNGTYPMHRVTDGQPLYEADVSTGLECPAPADGGPTVVTVQVRLKLSFART